MTHTSPAREFHAVFSALVGVSPTHLSTHLSPPSRRPFSKEDFYEGDRKVNVVCEALRAALLPRLRGPSSTAAAAPSVAGAEAMSALQPTLCTYARQRPPLLVEALALIRDVCASPDAAGIAPTNGGNARAGGSLSTGKVQSALRYLAFLADGAALFDAALGDCDFDMARAVARQCQMDPKVYLPLLQVRSARCQRSPSTHPHLFTLSVMVPTV